jgi:pyrimidine-nucleoside phosphorylase
LPQANFVTEVEGLSGWLEKIDTLGLAYFVNEMGGGRQKKEDVINPAVGIVLGRKIGDSLDNEVLCHIHHDEALDANQIARVKACFSAKNTEVKKPPFVHKLV